MLSVFFYRFKFICLETTLCNSSLVKSLKEEVTNATHGGGGGGGGGCFCGQPRLRCAVDSVCLSFSSLGHAFLGIVLVDRALSLFHLQLVH